MFDDLFPTFFFPYTRRRSPPPFNYSSTVPRLPQETVCPIVDELAILPDLSRDERRETLAACSTASSAFQDPCQIHIFRHLVITAWNEANGEAYNRLCATSPRICDYVKSLSLSPRWGSEDMNASYLFSGTLLQLPNMHTFSLQPHWGSPCMRWGTISDMFRNNILSLLQSPALTTLTLHSIEDIPTIVLCLCSRLQNLTMTDCRFIDIGVNDNQDTPASAETFQTQMSTENLCINSDKLGLADNLDLSHLSQYKRAISKEDALAQRQAIMDCSALKSLIIANIDTRKVIDGKNTIQ